jgi:hypothetical protein
MPALEYASQHLCSSQRLRHNSYIEILWNIEIQTPLLDLANTMCTVQVHHNNIHGSRTATQTSRRLWQVPLNEKTAGCILNPVVSSCSVTFRPSDMSSCPARSRELRWTNASCAHCAFCYRKCQAASGFNAYEHCHLTGPLTISKNWKSVCCIFAIASRAWFSPLPSCAFLVCDSIGPGRECWTLDGLRMRPCSICINLFMPFYQTGKSLALNVFQCSQKLVASASIRSFTKCTSIFTEFVVECTSREVNWHCHTLPCTLYQSTSIYDNIYIYIILYIYNTLYIYIILYNYILAIMYFKISASHFK